jgi:type II secretory pathway component PulL
MKLRRKLGVPYLTPPGEDGGRLKLYTVEFSRVAEGKLFRHAGHWWIKYGSTTGQKNGTIETSEYKANWVVMAPVESLITKSGGWNSV